MKKAPRLAGLVASIAALLVTSAGAQSNAPHEDFRAIAIANDNLGAGAGVVQMQITRWSSDAERERLVNTLIKEGADELLVELRRNQPVGMIKTPDSLGYPLRYAYQTRNEEGGRQIVIATDRPISFWEAWNRPRVSDYPFTVIQMEIGPDGRGKGTMSYATRIRAYGRTIELENFTTAPVMLTEVEAVTDY
jgi:hypothetical protein